MKYKLQDLIDIDHFQNLQDRLNKIYSFPSSIIDNEGNILTATAWQDICTKFHRKNSEAALLCIKSDQYIKDHLHGANPAVSYRCPHGLVDNATPIIINGIHYGNFFTGQFFLEEPNIDFFRGQAKKYGFDEDAYIDAVRKVPIWTKAKLEDYLFFIKGLIAVISESGLKRLKEIENRKQIERSEYRYRSVLKTAMDGYWLTDTKGRLLEVNDAYCSMCGYSESELLTMQITDLEAVENPNLVTAHMQEVIRKGSDRFESKHRRRDGTIFDVEVSIQFRPEEGGQCVCFLRDITERKKADEAIRTANEKMRLAADSAQLGIWDLDIKNNRLEWDDWMFRLYGLSRDHFGGAYEAWQAGVHPDDLDRSSKEVEQALRGEKEFDTEFRVVRPDGVVRHLKAHATVSRDAQGEPVHMTGINYDISERKQAEEALRESEQKWRKILIETPQIGVGLDPQAEILFANKRFGELTGWRTEDILGRNWFDLFVPQDVREEVREVFDRVMHARDTIGYSTHENEILTRSGERLNVAWSNVLTKDPNGAVVDVTCLGIDLTERKRAEEALSESERKFKSFSEQSLVGIYLIQDGVFKYVNPKFAGIFGYSVEECENMPYQHLVFPEDLDTVEEQVRKRIAGEVESVRYAFRGIKKNGDVIQVEIFGSSMEYKGRSAAIGTMLDITARRQAEEALRANEAKMRSIFRAAPIGIGVVSNRVLIDVNDRFCDMTGYAGHELIGKDARMLYPTDEDYEYVGREKYRQIAERGTGTVETRFKRKDGKIIDVLMSSTPLDPDDLSIGVTFTALDITERKQIEEELRKSERRFREFAEMLPEVVFEVDVHMNLTFINRHAFTIFGFTEKDFDERLNALDMLVPEDREKAAKNAAKRFRGEELGAIEYCALRKDGTVFPVLLHASPIIHQGTAKGIRGVIVDMTEHKKAQNEIVKQKHLFETMFNTIPDGVVITDTNREIQLVNSGMESTFGYKPDELLGKTTEMLYTNKDRFKEAGAVVFDKDAKKQGDLYVTYYRDKSGREFPGETFGAKLFDENNRWIGNLGIMRDITEREQAQKHVQHVQKMEALGTLAGGIAHDFNNVLAAMMGYTELALEDIAEEAPGKEHLQQVLKSGVRAKNLVQQILSFSRRTDPEKKPLQLAPIIKETMNLLRATTPTTIEIIQEVEAGPHTVLADPTQIHQLLMNLCTNAAHAMREQGGTLKISLERVDFEKITAALRADLRPGAYNRLSVSDNGEGMDKETVERIFEPFFTTKETGQGTGMGLAVVHGIVKSHGGIIKVDSESGKGSTFHVYLPFAGSQAEVDDTTDEKRLPIGTESVLFVDDETVLSDIGKKMLERLGYQVTAMTSSLEALKAFEAKPDRFHLVITDQTMPKMTGTQLAKEMLRIRPDIPIIICTGFSAQISEEKTKELGVRRLLIKPFVLRDVAEVIREVLDESKA